LLESTTRSQVLARFGSTLLARISNADVRSSSLSRPHLRNIHCRSRIRGHIGDREVSEDRYKSTTRAWNWAPVLSRGLPLPARASSDGQCSQQRQREPGRRPIPAQTEAVDNIQWAELIGPLAGEAGCYRASEQMPPPRAAWRRFARPARRATAARGRGLAGRLVDRRRRGAAGQA
jgi:hypothetical protein